jgi:hypothetical protein
MPTRWGRVHRGVRLPQAQPLCPRITQLPRYGVRSGKLIPKLIGFRCYIAHQAGLSYVPKLDLRGHGVWHCVWCRRSGSLIGFFILFALILIALGLRGVPMIILNCCRLRGTLRPGLSCLPAVCLSWGNGLASSPLGRALSVVPGTVTQGKLQRFGTITSIFRIIVYSALLVVRLIRLSEAVPTTACIGDGGEGALRQLLARPA